MSVTKTSRRDEFRIEVEDLGIEVIDPKDDDIEDSERVVDLIAVC